MERETASLNAVCARLQKLEAQNRRLKRVMAVLALAVGALVLMGQSRGVPGVPGRRDPT